MRKKRLQPYAFSRLLTVLVCLVAVFALALMLLSPARVTVQGAVLFPVSLHSVRSADYSADPIAAALPAVSTAIIGDALRDADRGGGSADQVYRDLQSPVPTAALPPGTTLPPARPLPTATAQLPTPAPTQIQPTPSELPTQTSTETGLPTQPATQPTRRPATSTAAPTQPPGGDTPTTLPPTPTPPPTATPLPPTSTPPPTATPQPTATRTQPGYPPPPVTPTRPAYP